MFVVKLKDKHFKRFLPSDDIERAVNFIGDKMNSDFAGKKPLFISVLNGSFLFAADLMKTLTIDCEITFVKLASYQGTQTTGNVRTLIGFDEDITNRTVVILEDIVDTGNTLEVLVARLKELNPLEIKVAALLYKPEAYTKDIPVDYVGFKVENDFLVGYGLDYDGLGRNLRDIYKLEE
ncbi:MAG: hypoxanthine phosphoribosyltransferase [Sphingobacteriales bacterium JAD_PAG50586_3]|nr:MAG: hypoxanthine phosphoribosyltransferase [Sphingobacteriales bacterium JAD_PAG50586_3]